MLQQEDKMVNGNNGVTLITPKTMKVGGKRQGYKYTRR